MKCYIIAKLLNAIYRKIKKKFFLYFIITKQQKKDLKMSKIVKIYETGDGTKEMLIAFYMLINNTKDELINIKYDELKNKFEYEIVEMLNNDEKIKTNIENMDKIVLHDLEYSFDYLFNLKRILFYFYIKEKEYIYKFADVNYDKFIKVKNEYNVFSIIKLEYCKKRVNKIMPNLSYFIKNFN